MELKERLEDPEPLVIATMLIAAVSTIGSLASAYYAIRRDRRDIRSSRRQVVRTFQQVDRALAETQRALDSFAILVDGYGILGAPLVLGGTAQWQSNRPVDRRLYKAALEAGIAATRRMTDAMANLSEILDEEDAEMVRPFLSTFEDERLFLITRSEYAQFLSRMNRRLEEIRSLSDTIKDKYLG